LSFDEEDYRYYFIINNSWFQIKKYR
jgi:hypothetical protein